MSNRAIGAIFAALAWGGCSGSDAGAALCTGVTPPCIGLAAGASEKTVQEAFVKIGAGGTIVFGDGTYSFVNPLNLATKNVTVKGQGMDKTILDYGKQRTGSQGLYCNKDGFTLEDLTIQNTFGDAVKVEGASGVTFQRVHILWQSTDLPNHGAYGLYPVQCTNVVIQDSTVEGASDSGIYVGQSNQIVVRRNTAKGNVAGIEIENSHSADVYGNTATNNTAGILIFALPGLTQRDTKNVRVYMNTITTNNQPSFAAMGDIVAKVPDGVGLLVMASNGVELFQNTVQGNQTAQAAVISYYVSQLMFDATTYYPYPQSIWFHDNTFSGGGDHPDQSNLLGIALSHTLFANNVVSTILYDGILDPMVTGTRAGNPMDLCLSANGAATFANLHADMMTAGMVGFDKFTTDAAPYNCMLAPLPAVSIPGLQ